MGQTDEQMDGWRDRQTDRRTDRQTDGWGATLNTTCWGGAHNELEDQQVIQDRPHLIR